VVVTIQDEAGPAIAFAIDAAVAGGLGIEEAGAEGEGLGEVVLPPGGVEGFGFAGVEEADADGGIGIEQADGEEFIFAVENDGKFAELAGTVLFADAVGEEPGMAAAEDGFGGGGDAEAEAGWWGSFQFKV
jgi:hypothetical protein